MAIQTIRSSGGSSTQDQRRRNGVGLIALRLRYFMHIYMHASTRTSIREFIHTCVHTQKCACTHAQVHVHTQTRTHTHKQTNTHRRPSFVVRVLWLQSGESSRREGRNSCRGVLVVDECA